MPTTHRGRARVRLEDTILAALLLVLLVVAAGCGSDDSSSSSGSGGAGSAGVDQAKAVVAKAEKRPTRSPVRSRSASRSRRARRSPSSRCGVEACAVQGPILAEEGDRTLGWKVKQVGTDGSPEKVQGRSSRPSAEAPTPYHRRGGQVMPWPSSSPEARQGGGRGVRDLLLPGRAGKDVPRLQHRRPKQNGADRRDARCEGRRRRAVARRTPLYVNVSAFPILERSTRRSSRRSRSAARTASTTSIDVPPTSLGKDAPDRIVSYLRSHPDTNYVALSVATRSAPACPPRCKAPAWRTRSRSSARAAAARRLPGPRTAATRALVPGAATPTTTRCSTRSPVTGPACRSCRRARPTG